MSDKDVELKISADSASAETAFARVGEAGKKAAYDLGESFEKINSKMEKVNKLFEKMAGLMALGFASEKIVEAARHLGEYGDSVEKSSQKSGIAAEKLQGLQFAAKMSDISSKDLDNSLKHLAKGMEGAGVAGNKVTEAFAAVGLKASDLKNMKTDEVLAKVADAFANSKDGAGKAAVAMELFGKSGTDMIPFLNKGSASIDELVAQAQKMGIVMSGDALESAAHLNEQFKVMDAQIEGLQRRASLALVPAFLQITSAFSESTQKGGALAGMFDGLGDILLFITKAASYLAQAMYAIDTTIGATAAAVVAAVHGDFAAAKQIMDMGDKDIAASTKKFEAFRATLEKPVNVPPQPKPESDDGKKDLHLGSGAAGSQIAEWKAALEAKKEAEGQFFKDSLADDEAFWAEKLNHVRKGSKDEIAVKHELFGIHKQMAQQQLAEDQAAAKEQQTLDGLKVDLARDAALAQLDIERENLTLAKSLGQISDQQEVVALEKLEQQKYQIEAQAAQDKIALEELTGSAKQKQLDALAKMEEKHNLEIVKLNNKSVLAVQKDWGTMLGAVSSAFDKSITGMIMGTQTLQKALANIGQSTVAEFVNLGVKRVTTWGANEAAMLFASKAKNAAVATLNSTGTVTAMTAKGTEATAVVTSDAAEGAAGAAASQAAIPVVGPGLAIAAFAATMALILGARSMIKSSAGGDWRIPSDRLNFVHADETILPADKSRGLDELISNGSSSGGATHVHVHAMDSRDVLRSLKQGGALHKALTGLNRNFAKI